MSGALAELVAAYQDRHGVARAWRAGGGQVVGYVGADVPVELLTAAGVLGVRLAGDPELDCAPGDRYLGRGLDPAARSLLTGLLSGAYDYLDRLVIGRDCEAHLRLFYALRELRRVEPELRLPVAYLVDVLHLPHVTTAAYNRVRLAQFGQWLGEWLGQPIEADALAAAVGRHDTQRRLLAELARLRRSGPARLSGVQALAVIGAGARLTVDAHVRLLCRLLGEVDGLPELRGHRLFVTGSAHDTPHVYAALEAAGAVIVGEDHDWGDLWYERPVSPPTVDASTMDELLAALATRYQYNGPSAQRGSTSVRAAHTALAVDRASAQTLLCYGRAHDEAPPWDFAAQCAAIAIPAVRVERQEYGRIAAGALEPIGSAA